MRRVRNVRMFLWRSVNLSSKIEIRNFQDIVWRNLQRISYHPMLYSLHGNQDLLNFPYWIGSCGSKRLQSKSSISKAAGRFLKAPLVAALYRRVHVGFGFNRNRVSFIRPNQSIKIVSKGRLQKADETAESKEEGDTKGKSQITSDQ